jgi:hypothetical protein
MKILFIGNANSFLLIRLAEQLSKSIPGLMIDVATMESSISVEAKKTFHTVFFDAEKRFGEDIRFAKVLFLAKKLNSILNQIDNDYDGVCLLYLSAVYRLTWNKIKQKSSLQVVSLFGSEFYRAGSIIRSMQKKMLHEATSITYSNELLWKDVRSFFDLKKSKGKRCLFGLSVLDEIDKVTVKDIESFRNDFQINNHQQIVACGSNSSVNQSFEEIITSLELVKDKLTDVVVFFQFPDVTNNSYAQKIVNLIESTGIQYRIIDRFLSDYELASYRKAAAVMIQVQNTDQLSGAMQEHLYAGSEVITGDWLPYAIFDEIGIEYSKVKERKDIGPLLIELLAQPNQENENSSKIGKLSKWNNAISEWKTVFKLN